MYSSDGKSASRKNTVFRLQGREIDNNLGEIASLTSLLLHVWCVSCRCWEPGWCLQFAATSSANRASDLNPSPLRRSLKVSFGYSFAYWLIECDKSFYQESVDCIRIGVCVIWDDSNRGSTPLLISWHYWSKDNTVPQISILENWFYDPYDSDPNR